LILTPRYTEDAQALWAAAGRLGWKVERLPGWRVPEHLKHVHEPVLYAEALFGPSLAEQFGLQLINPAEDWLVSLPEEHRKRTISLSTMAQAQLLESPAFIKPPNDKSFPARVYTGAELPRDYSADMSVLISEVVHWELEFRCFVLDRKLSTYSIYARHGELQRENGFVSSDQENAALEQFMATLLSDTRVRLPKATVVDVGIIEGRGWACVEQNAAWGAGIYGCEPERVLNTLRFAAIALVSEPEP
jgi:hypothetical protein